MMITMPTVAKDSSFSSKKSQPKKTANKMAENYRQAQSSGRPRPHPNVCAS